MEILFALGAGGLIAVLTALAMAAAVCALPSMVAVAYVGEYFVNIGFYPEFFSYPKEHFIICSFVVTAIIFILMFFGRISAIVCGSYIGINACISISALTGIARYEWIWIAIIIVGIVIGFIIQSRVADMLCTDFTLANNLLSAIPSAISIAWTYFEYRMFYAETHNAFRDAAGEMLADELICEIFRPWGFQGIVIGIVTGILIIVGAILAEKFF